MSLIIAVDFDGTIVDHQFPDIGEIVPGAFEWMKKFQEKGARLILWTMRSDGRMKKGGERKVLTEAVELCRQNGIEFWGINENPDQHSWTSSKKQYANVYIDDAAFGCPLVENPNSKHWVDWSKVGPAIISMIEKNRR